ncbi:MAG: alginate O-acetyltransferase complex protein AlgI, partial [Acidimicrobiaceae bacterium]
MLFPTIRFAIFFALVLPTSWLLLPHPRRWRVFMLLASFVFYASWNNGYVLLLAGSIVGNQLFARRIARTEGPPRVRWTGLAVAANLAVLGWYKYAGFAADSTSTFLGWFGIDAHIEVPNLLLPVGISFFTFQALSYVIDVHRRRCEPASFLDFAVYLSFFPHLVAGPIVRASELLPQIRRRHDPRQVDGTLAFWLIASGLFKKVVIASYLGETADSLFAFPHQHGGLEALVAVYAYALQIYADFSGYTDMAIGLALLLGFRFPANFDAPYTATSLQDFWRRWHMTLSRWLRDYLYIPLGGNHGSRRRTYRNLMITMLLGGLWHGAAWTFVVWGGIHGGGLALERWWRERKEPPSTPAREPDPEPVLVGIGGVTTALLPSSGTPAEPEERTKEEEPRYEVRGVVLS